MTTPEDISFTDPAEEILESLGLDNIRVQRKRIINFLLSSKSLESAIMEDFLNHSSVSDYYDEPRGKEINDKVRLLKTDFQKSGMKTYDEYYMYYNYEKYYNAIDQKKQERRDSGGSANDGNYDDL